jgi:hypothetical protein
MKPTIAALFGVIAMACASDYSKHGDNSSPETVSSFCPGRVVQKFKRNQVKNELLNVQKFQGLPLFSMTRKSLFADEDLDVIKVLRQTPRWWLTE